MAYPSSGVVSASAINTEMGYPSNTTFSWGGTVGRAITGKTSGPVAADNFYGKVCFVCSGGSISFTGSYKIHTFTSNATFSVLAGKRNIEYLVIGGGGGGGRGLSGTIEGAGGGAGGYRTSVPGQVSGRFTSAESVINLGIADYGVIIGAGGTGVSVSTDGGHSSFHTIVSLGGGRGATWDGSKQGAGYTGGCGGGGWNNNSLAGQGTAAQGYDGGNGNTYNAAGGGGGAGSAGQANPASQQGGIGGSGLGNNITGIAIARAGGGGGASGTGGAGGDGGGGKGASANETGVNGTANYGSGGGGGSSQNSANGGNGGSGIIIVRYLNT